MISVLIRQTIRHTSFFHRLRHSGYQLLRLFGFCGLVAYLALFALPTLAEASAADLSISTPELGTVVRNSNGSYSFPVTFTVTNVGSIATSAAPFWYDLVYLSRNGVLDANSVVLDYTTHSGSLAPGASYTVTKTYTTSVAPGNYTLFAKADGGGTPVGGNNTDNGRLPETNESNNASSPFALTLPNTIPDVSISTPELGTVVRNSNGSYSFPVTFTVTNIGPIATFAAPYWYDLVYLSSNGVLDANSVVLDYTTHSGSLAPGASYTVTKTYTTSVAPGNYTLFAKADGGGTPVGGNNTDNGRLPETNESNNASSPFALTLPNTIPDVSISTPELGTVVRNSNGSYSFPVTFTVTNIGPIATFAAPYWYDLVYLSSNGVLDANSVALGYTTHSGSLAPGASYTVTQNYTTSTSVVGGDFTLIVKADGRGAPVGGTNTDNGVLPESNESNNTQTIPVELTSSTLPDFSVSNVSVGTIVPGLNGSYTIPLGFTVNNGGSVAAAPNWDDLVYLSSNGVLDANSIVIGNTRHSTSLAVGTGYAVAKTYTTPNSMPPGNYSLIIKADGHAPGVNGGSNTDSGSIAEISERNNTEIRVITLARPADTEGPQLSNIRLDGNALADAAVLRRNGSITLAATDLSGIARIEVLLDNAVVAVASGSGNYTAALNLDKIANGAHTLALRATDSVGNISTRSFAITVSHSAPDVPVLKQPATGLVTRVATLTVAGSAKPGSTVQIILNGQPTGSGVQAGDDGRFGSTLTLANGSNRIAASASDQYGSSAASPEINVTLDTSVPASPTNLTAIAQAAGKVRLTWARSSDAHTLAYEVYRAASAFSAITEASKVNNSSLSATTFDDLPPQDGTWFYRVVAVNTAATSSQPSNLAQASSDSIAPKALSIVYSPLGKTDPQTGRIGQGRVNVILTTSETLANAPYLALVPPGGAPISVDLLANGPTTWQGSFVIDANTPAGTANVLFSARDAAGNRGTEIGSGASLKIDTQGPDLSGIVLSPQVPIKNTGSTVVNATFTFGKAPVGVPQVKFQLSGPGRSAQSVGSLTPLNGTSNATSYSASFTLPSDAGQAAPENLSFSSEAQDDLENRSTRVSAMNRFQVYQGNLPPLLNPLGFSAKALVAGKVKLAWQALDEAQLYQIYRKGPNQTELQPLVRTSGVEYIDQTTQDGNYQYAVASVRQSNGQEAVSSVGAVIEVRALAAAPGAPQGLNLQLTGQGIYATWQVPAGGNLDDIDYYNLYRASGTAITSIDGLTPIKSRIKNPQTWDSNPSPTQGAYAVTAVDKAGNESAISNSAYLNASLLPVRNVSVTQSGNDMPQLSWQAPNGNLAGYLVYVSNGNTQIKLTPNLITDTRFTDTGYVGGERLYSVVAVDSTQVELARRVLLPAVTSQIISGLPIKRGVMNKVQVQVSNTSNSALSGVQAVVRLPIDRNGTQFKEHRSEAVTLSANQTWILPVIVGGYAELAGSVDADVGVEIMPAEDEKIRLVRSQRLNVVDDALVVGMATSEFTRGGSGKLKLTIENTSEVDIELQTATQNGAKESSELRFKILDADGNVLATQPYKQVLGAGVVTLPDGQSVARIAAGSRYTLEEFSVNIPAASPASIRVLLEVDKLRYHSGKEDEVQIAGRGSERTVSLLETAWYGEVNNVTPANSFGDTDVVISGRALERGSNAVLPNTRLKLILNQQGFERNFGVLTDSSGNFSYRFTPTLQDSGSYRVSAVHPDMTDRPEQKGFTISRVTVGPNPFKIDLPKGVRYGIPLVAKAGAGSSASNVRLSFDAASQPGQSLPAGIHLELPPATNVAERQSVNLPVIFSASAGAQPSGKLILNVLSDENGSTPIGQVRIDYTLSDAKPYLIGTPGLVETGLAVGSSQIESVSIKNNGLQEATNLQFTLTKADGNPAPEWASIVSSASAGNGRLAIGQSLVLDLAFTPPAGTQEGVYEMKLNFRGDNIANQSLNVYVSLSQSGLGNVLFKAADIYTATLDGNARLIPGLQNASISLQNEEVPTISQTLETDALGEAWFQGVPAGRYKFRAKANHHQEVAGRLIVKPGVTLTQPVFLNYNLVTVEWSVREIAIQDRYEITLNTTFETNVPAAVVVMQPASINLPKMVPGNVYYGELSLTNYGLVRADDVTRSLPNSDNFFRYEFLTDIPQTLEAKQRITIPYRVISLRSLEGSGNNGFASGGGCYSYGSSASVGYSYICANGSTSTGGTGSSWFSVSTSSCSGREGQGTAILTTPEGPTGSSPPRTSSGMHLPGSGGRCVDLPGAGGSGGSGGSGGPGPGGCDGK